MVVGGDGAVAELGEKPGVNSHGSKFGEKMNVHCEQGTSNQSTRQLELMNLVNCAV
jgi:hypothetical protein